MDEVVVNCPFCGETDFDYIGLVGHLTNITEFGPWCPKNPEGGGGKQC